MFNGRDLLYISVDFTSAFFPTKPYNGSIMMRRKTLAEPLEPTNQPFHWDINLRLLHFRQASSPMTRTRLLTRVCPAEASPHQYHPPLLYRKTILKNDSFRNQKNNTLLDIVFAVLATDRALAVGWRRRAQGNRIK